MTSDKFCKQRVKKKQGFSNIFPITANIVIEKG